MKQRITLTLSDELCTVLRVEAAKKNKRPNHIVEQALMHYLGTGRNKSKSKSTPKFTPPAPEPSKPEPPDLTLTPEEEEEWANALAIGE